MFINLWRGSGITLTFILMIIFGLFTDTCLTAPSTSTESETSEKDLSGDKGSWLPNVMSNEEMQEIYELATGKPMPSISDAAAGVLSLPLTWRLLDCLRRPWRRLPCR